MTGKHHRLLGKPISMTNRSRGSSKGSDDEPLSIGVPLAKLIKRKLIETPELVMLASSRSVAAERFRRLRTVLVNQEAGHSQVIVVCSGAPEEGKSVVAMNLALAFAGERDERTIIVDADLRRPTIAGRLHPAPQLGLGEVLSGMAVLDHAVLNLENSPLKVLPAGRPVREPTELLGSEALKALVQDLRQRYDRVIIDTPPIVPFTDADVIGGVSDGMLMVVRAGQTAISSYQQAVEAVTSTRIIGTVLNEVRKSLADSDRRYSEYHDHYYRDRKD